MQRTDDPVADVKVDLDILEVILALEDISEVKGVPEQTPPVCLVPVELHGSSNNGKSTTANTIQSLTIAASIVAWLLSYQAAIKPCLALAIFIPRVFVVDRTQLGCGGTLYASVSHQVVGHHLNEQARGCVHDGHTDVLLDDLQW